MHKTWVGSPMSGYTHQKKNFCRGAALDPDRRGCRPPCDPRATPGATYITWIQSWKEYNTYPTFSHLLFSFHRGPKESLVIGPILQHPLFLYTKRTSECSQTSSMHLQHSSKCPPLLAITFFLKHIPHKVIRNINMLCL